MASVFQSVLDWNDETTTTFQAVAFKRITAMLPLLQNLLKSTTSSCTSRRSRKRRQANRGDMQAQVLEDRMLLAGIFTSDDIVVETGDGMPSDNNGNFDGNFDWFLEPPTLNETGQAIFEGRVAFTQGGLFWASSTQPVTLIIRDGQDVPTIPGATFHWPGGGISLAFNNHGQTVFSTQIDNGGSIGEREAYIGSSVNNMDLVSGHGVSLNNSGQIAYGIPNGIANNDAAIFRTDASGNTVQIIREGQAIPALTNPDTFSGASLGPSDINENGQVVFWGFGDSNLLGGIYVGDGTTLKGSSINCFDFLKSKGVHFCVGL